MTRRDIERARRELELARTTSERLWAEYREYAKMLEPARGVASPEELSRLKEASEWTGKLHAAEQTLFMAENGTPGIVGAHGDYQWLSVVDCDISTLLRLCPDVVVGKYLAITSIDSGTLKLTEQEKAEGWWTDDTAKVFRGTSWSSPEYRAALNTEMIGRSPTVLASLRSMGCRMKRMPNAAPDLTNGMSSSNQCRREKWRSLSSGAGFA